MKSAQQSPSVKSTAFSPENSWNIKAPSNQSKLIAKIEVYKNNPIIPMV